MTGLGRAVLLLPLLISFACASLVPPRVGEPAPVAPKSSEESAYQVIFDRYSDHGESYAVFDDVIFTAATYQTLAFREARIHRQAQFQNRPRQWELTTLDLERKENDVAHDFLVAVHLQNTRYEDFDRPNSMWHVALVTSAGEVAPQEIRRIGRGDLNLSAYYRYVDDFWIVFYMRFPRKLPSGAELAPPGTDKLTMKISSSLGQVEMKFPVQ